MGADYRSGHHGIELFGPSAQTGPGIVRYFTVNAAGAAAAAVEIPVPSACIFRSLRAHVNNPPGVGEDIEITVMNNNAPTPLTCTIEGAVDLDGADIVNEAVFAAGDRICIRYTTSGACAVANLGVGVLVRQI